MCVIAAKPKNVDMPDKTTLSNMWYRNHDGAGLMWVQDGKVHIEKGFMTFDSFLDALDRIGKQVDLKRTSVVMHFRITTHGGTKPENCHPFPCESSVGALKKLKFTSKLGIAHNGIISSVSPRKGISDTMEYILTQLSPLYKAVPDFYRNKHLLEMISNATGSRLAFLNAKGEIYTVGDFIEDGGIMYSNTSYKGYTRTFTYGAYGEWGKGDADLPWWDNHNTSDGYMAKRTIMWLDETEGEFILTDDGDMLDTDVGIDANENCYVYDYDLCAFVPLEGQALNAQGLHLRFDADSDRGVYIEDVILPYKPSKKAKK